jgi:hypothetical protein
MNLRKKIFVGSIILLLLTPVLTTAEINKNTNISSKSTVNSGGNHSYWLGTLDVTHYEYYLSWHDFKGARMNFTRNLNTIFNFTEVNGVVWMNFSIIVRHHLNLVPPGYFIRPRYTLIDYAYIHYHGIDYFTKFDEQVLPVNSFLLC